MKKAELSKRNVALQFDKFQIYSTNPVKNDESDSVKKNDESDSVDWTYNKLTVYRIVHVVHVYDGRLLVVCIVCKLICLECTRAYHKRSKKPSKARFRPL